MLCIDGDEFVQLAEEGRIQRMHNSTGRILACLRSLKRVSSRRGVKVIILNPL